MPQFLQAANHPDALAAGTLLSDLHGDRIRADYRLSDASVESVNFAKHKVEIAADIQRLLASFRAACDSDAQLRSSLRAGIDKIKAVYKVK